MGENDVHVRLELGSSALKKTLENIFGSAEGFLLRETGDSGPVDLIVMELGSDYDSQFQVIQSLLSLGKVGEIFLTAPKPDPDVLMRALRLGIREFLHQPLNAQEVLQALDRFRQRRETQHAARTRAAGAIVNVAASKGGVGNTTVAVNLAASLAQLNKYHSVALVDMNLLFGEVPLFLDLKGSYHWGEIAKNIGRLDSMFLMNVLQRHRSGIYVLPSPTELDGSHDISPEVLEDLLRLMQSMFDYTVVDSGHSLDETALRLLELSDHVLLTSILSVPCLTNLNRLCRLLSEIGFSLGENARVVVNRYMKDGEISLSEAEESIRMKVSWTVANDYRTTMSAINQGKPLTEVAAKAQVTRNIRQIAVDLSQKHTGEEKKRTFLQRLLRLAPARRS